MIRLATRRSVLFGAMLFACVLALVPMRAALGWFALGEQGLSARVVAGVLWSGRLREARFGEVALGDLKARLAFWPLLVGRARIELDGMGMRPLSGALTVSRHTVGIDDFTGAVDAGRVFQPLPVTGLELEGASVLFRDGRCEAAEGRVRATLAGEAGGVPLPAVLAGPARCDAGALLLPLASAAGTETATLRVTGGGRYRAEFVLSAADPALAPRLERAGFVAGPGGWRLAVEGRL